MGRVKEVCPSCGKIVWEPIEVCTDCGARFAPQGGPLQVRYEIFRAGAFTPWEDVLSDAAEFATRVDVDGDRLINISQSADRSTGVVVVWYWG